MKRPSTPQNNEVAGAGVPVDRPVFIVGHPRSGSSLIQRRLVAPLIRLVERIGSNVAQSAEQGHQIRINGVEEGLFLHRLDMEIVTYLCPWLLTDPRYAEAGMDRLVLECNPSVFRLPDLLEIFPDTRVVYLVRSPEACVRSFQAFTHRFVAPLLSADEAVRSTEPSKRPAAESRSFHGTLLRVRRDLGDTWERYNLPWEYPGD